MEYHSDGDWLGGSRWAYADILFPCQGIGRWDPPADIRQRHLLKWGCYAVEQVEEESLG